jgi:hypothetical protein
MKSMLLTTSKPFSIAMMEESQLAESALERAQLTLQREQLRLIKLRVVVQHKDQTR